MATVGFATTGYAIYKKESPLLWSPLAYFSLMELLQAYTYTVIDQCGLPANQLATLLGYLHICFQPFFGVAMALYFVPANVRRRAFPLAFTVAGMSAVFMLIQLYPFGWAETCRVGRTLCGEAMCSVSGDWHIAWELPLNSLGEFKSLDMTDSKAFLLLLGHGFTTYNIAMFLLPALLGSWKFVLYHVIMGPTLASLTTSNPNEMPAVWCLLSIGFLILVIKTPIRNYLHVKSWPLWRFFPADSEPVKQG